VLGRLDEYKGTLIFVSHDRMFLDSVVTSVFAFEPRGHIERYVGGYTDWLRQSPAGETDNPPAEGEAPAPQRPKTQTGPRQTRSSAQDQRAGRLPKIAALEASQASAPDGGQGFYDKPWRHRAGAGRPPPKQGEHERSPRWLELEEQKDRARKGARKAGARLYSRFPYVIAERHPASTRMTSPRQMPRLRNHTITATP
jgi:hypothetical protein